MADIRINSLTTTASSTASDDFIAVDGATNGTRKLNAYNPSFGGNVTIGGKLDLATHTTSAGGIGFGTDTSLYRGAGGNLCLNDTGTNAAFSLCNGGTKRADFYAQGSTSTLIIGPVTAGWSTVLMSGAGTTALTITSGQQVQANATTASTSTSTGALVVSGGVGVAKDLYVGGTVITLQPGSGTTAPQQKIIGPSGATYGPSLFLDASASTSGKTYIVGSGLSGDNGGLGSFYVYDVSAANSVLKIVGGNTTLAGNITTAAPAGGTAAAWKLGTVATVSPTSPNRTIEVDIGGTIYYIHAKTTNN